MYSLNYSPNYINSIEIKFKNGNDDFGYITYKNGDKYEGYMKDQLATGNGRLTLQTGAYFEGQFDNSGLCDGVLSLPEGVYFKDVFDCDCFVEGTFVFSDGTTFTGAWNLENDEWVVVEGHLKSKDGNLISTFQGENLIKFDDESHTRVKIVFARCQILGNSSFYEGGFDPENQTLDGKGIVVGSTRKYSLTNLKKGKKEGEWLFVNYWEDLPYTKRVTFENNQKVKCKTMYGNGMQFEGKDDFGKGVATFPFICDWLKIEGELLGSNSCPVMKGVLILKGGDNKGNIEIRDKEGQLGTIYDGQKYDQFEDLISKWTNPGSPKKLQSPKIKKQIVTSIMVSQNDTPDMDMGRKSRRSSISQTKRSRILRKLENKRNSVTEFYDETGKHEQWMSRITITQTPPKLSKSHFETREKQNPDPKKFQTGNTRNLFDNEMGNNSKQMGTKKKVQKISYLGSDDEKEEDLFFNYHLTNPEGLMSDNEKDIQSNQMIDLISDMAAPSPVISPPTRVNFENTGNKSHFSFNHSFQDLQSFDGMQMNLITSVNSGHPNQPASMRNIKHSLSSKQVSSYRNSVPGQRLGSLKHNQFSSKLINKSSSPNESSGDIFRKQNPTEPMKTFFVEKDNKILLFKDIQNFYSVDEENLHISGKMISYTKEYQYEGEILNDMMDGKGLLIYDDKKITGTFDKNIITYGTIDYEKMVYKGQIKNLKMHGKGEVMINQTRIKAFFTNGLLDEEKDVFICLTGNKDEKVEIITTKNQGMYLLSQLKGDNIFIFDIKKQLFRKSY